MGLVKIVLPSQGCLRIKWVDDLHTEYSGHCVAPDKPSTNAISHCSMECASPNRRSMNLPFLFLFSSLKCLMEHTWKLEGRVSVFVKNILQVPESSSEYTSGNALWELQSQGELKSWKRISKIIFLNTQTHKAGWPHVLIYKLWELQQIASGTPSCCNNTGAHQLTTSVCLRPLTQLGKVEHGTEVKIMI